MVRAYFKAAGPDVAAAVIQRVQDAAAAVFSGSRSGGGADRGPLEPLQALHGLPQLQDSYAQERREEVRLECTCT